MAVDMDEFWVFGYGSLMWNPGFRFEEKRTARAFGYRRSLCVRSWVHRGTERRPGLVLGLDYGGSCIGTAFRVAASDKADVIDYLRERELVTHVYKERMMPVQLADGRRVPALAYVIDRSHVQYAGALTATEAAATVAAAVGKSGPNTDYVLNTLSHLREMGIRDQWLEDVVAVLAAGGAASAQA
ncbi:gamma-glutamylcyclotransferase [Sinorhizobium numidicum]|uniref:glutathione-specific gamma-glutamylcyclotransferase n=1 Tax=Sinorhizobium numidicum TaxID=680248 RepID=A0ABY8D1B9_9HYPH|nr:gamma-glutamylcyclotransferase [Sinorhizobium numidicum]WEX76816.1 gamma-glutamylcyclotransferase [Sinorhizobium numidicum]WEX83477.1 gamma-glutamylcyclotransferase [Sinorhizobium numidicum]